MKQMTMKTPRNRPMIPRNDNVTSDLPFRRDFSDEEFIRVIDNVDWIEG